jgi:hypothetical protein
MVMGGLSWAWTNMALAEAWLGTNAAACRLDLTTYTQARLQVMKLATAGAAASVIRVKYRTVWDATVANWLQLGESGQVQVAPGTQQNVFLDSGWITIATAARAEVYLGLASQGGDGALDPAFGAIRVLFR